MKGKRLELLLMLFLIMSMSFSAGPKTYRDPFRQAKDGVPFVIAGTTGEFYDAQDAEPMLTCVEFGAFSYESVFAPNRDYYFLKITEVRELTFMIEFVDQRGETVQMTEDYSILKAEILSVFHDTMGIKAGDVVMLASSCVSAEAKGTVFFPEYVEGNSYYAQLGELVVDPEKARSHLVALDELSDYFISYFCYGLMPLRSDGMVEYYYKMMPEGKVLPYEINIGPVWAELPQEEFERGFREIIQTYSKRGS